MAGLATRTLQIGALSKLTGLSVDTIRFYESQGLVQSPRRSDGGFRLFSESAADVLRFIKSAQELGFSLEEIRELLTLRQDRVKSCPKMASLLRVKLESVRQKILALRSLESELKWALATCEVVLNDRSAASGQSCPALDQISRKQRRGTGR